MKRRRRHKKRRLNPIPTAKIAWAVGLTAVGVAVVWTGIYFATKSKALPTSTTPTPSGDIPIGKGTSESGTSDVNKPPVVYQAATQYTAEANPYQPGLHHGIDPNTGNY